MTSLQSGILIPTARLSMRDLDRFRDNPFENMIKFVVDIRQGRIASGGEMHADGEEALLSAGSHQADLWGANLWPWEVPPGFEFVAIINIRPSAGNKGMEIGSTEIRDQVTLIAKQWVDLK